MSDTPAPSSPLRPRARRLFLLAGLVAIGTACSLWLTAEWYAPWDLRVPDGAPIVEVKKSPPQGFAPVAAVAPQAVVRGWEVLDAEQAANRLREDEMLLAVEIDGQARCWPLNVMTGPQREVFNDELAGRAIAATW